MTLPAPILIALCALAGTPLSPASELAKLDVPVDGRWSIATGWENDWPSQWHHAKVTRTEEVDGWTIHHGRIKLAGGTWVLRDATRPHPRIANLTELRRRWHWTGGASIDQVTLSIRCRVDAPDAKPILPGISYYDNPAGQSVDPTRIPVLGAHDGARGYYEEHRFSMPLAAVEAGQAPRLSGAALHSLPSPAPHGHRADQWWSLGIERVSATVTELALLSGPTASNGKNGIIKANQRGFLPYPEPWLTVPPDTVIEKTAWLQTWPVSAPGDGFRTPVWTSIRLFDPFHTDGFPPLREVVARKLHDSISRWHKDDRSVGIDAFPDTRGRRRNWLDMGWAGQSEAVAYPFLLFGERFGIGDAVARAQEAVDFICSAPLDPQNGFAIRYDFDTHEWSPRTNPLSQGQAMHNLLNALRIARRTTASDPAKWEEFLRRATTFHAARIAAADWKPVSTNEAFLIAPLAQAATMFEAPALLAAARKAADYYGNRHLSMQEPYWGGTLDARCEDKEGAWAAFQGFLTLHQHTGESKYLAWAAHAADVVASYVYVWDVAMPAGRLADHAFKSRGWTTVSVQNMHLDVYGVLCAPAFWMLGELTGRTEYQQLARLMIVACGQLVDPTGRQGEQLHQTNYAQHYKVTANNLSRTRGDYVESWDVYWISAHFLTAAAQLEEMGVDWQTW